MNPLTSPLHLWDDARARAFEPFSLTRPVSELRAGAELIRRRWERVVEAPAAGFVAGAHLEHFEEWDAPRASAVVPAGSLVANARVVPSLRASRLAAGVTRLVCDSRLAAVVIAEDVSAQELLDAERLEDLPAAPGDTAELEGRWLERVWELVGTLGAQITDDVEALSRELAAARPLNVVILGSHPVLVEAGAMVEPMVCFDATEGPVLVRRGATVAAFSRIEGPSVIGEDTIVLGGKISVASLGPRCKVHGELSNVVILGHSNKSHDGFVGYSYLGRWVNIGASSVTSNLKNTYGPVSLWTPEGQCDTGMLFLGTFFGDHVKIGIGTVCNTGSVLGAGANVYGGATLPRVVPPFAWGDHAPFGVYELDRFLVVAERVMQRRHVELSEGMRRQLTAAHAARWSEFDR